MIVALASFAVSSHMRLSLKEFKLLHAALLISVSSETLGQAEDSGGGANSCKLLFTVASWHGYCFI